MSCLQSPLVNVVSMCSRCGLLGPGGWGRHDSIVLGQRATPTRPCRHTFLAPSNLWECENGLDGPKKVYEEITIHPHGYRYSETTSKAMILDGPALPPAQQAWEKPGGSHFGAGRALAKGCGGGWCQGWSRFPRCPALVYPTGTPPNGNRVVEHPGSGTFSLAIRHLLYGSEAVKGRYLVACRFTWVNSLVS